MFREHRVEGISAVICTFNGVERITNTLGAFKTQIKTEGIPWEVILVDNASKDNTSGLAKELMRDSEIDFTLLYEARPGKINAIEQGFARAKYEYLCIVDDDNWVCNDYIFKVYRVMSEHPDVGICGANGIGEFEVMPPTWFDDVAGAYGIGPQGVGEGYLKSYQDCLYGAASAIRKTAWEELKRRGFAFNLSGRSGKSLASGEDMELSQAMLLIGYKLWFSPSITFRHFMPAGRISWEYLGRLIEAFGRSDIVTFQYRSYLNIFNSYKKTIYRYYSLNLIYAIYRYIKTFPFSQILSWKSTEGKKKILGHKRYQAYLNELLYSRKKIKVIRQNIQKLMSVK